MGVASYSKGVWLGILKSVNKLLIVFTSNGTPSMERIRMSLDGNVVLQGELLFKCFHKRTATNSDSVFRVQFPSTVVQDYAISFSKAELDDAYKGE